MHHCKPTSIETELFIMVNHDIAKPLKKLMKSLNYQTLLVLIMPLIMVGCGNKSQPIEYEDIAGVKMAFEDGFNGSACVLIYDDTLAFWSYDPGHRFEIAHIKGDSVLNITSMCTIGQGPNEYLEAALHKTREWVAHSGRNVNRSAVHTKSTVDQSAGQHCPDRYRFILPQSALGIQQYCPCLSRYHNTYRRNI